MFDAVLDGPDCRRLSIELGNNIPFAVPSIRSGGDFDTPPAHLPEAEVLQIAAELHGLAGEFTQFATEKDDAFRVHACNRRAVVLKIAKSAEPQIDTDFQIQLLRYVERKVPAIPIPRMIPDREGRLCTDICADAPGSVLPA